MQKQPLGETGISISPVILGCGTFGGIGSLQHLIGRGLDEEASLATMDEAAALGINLFDTAYSYAGGASERIIGRWLAGRSVGRSEDIHLATKVGPVVRGGKEGIDLSPARIAGQFEQSLERLDLDRVEFCLSHAPDPHTPIEATLEGFTALIEEARVGHIGACNVSAQQLEEALLASERLGLPRYEWVQNEYNLCDRRDETDLFSLCREHGLGLTPYSPMAGGLLTGKYRRDEEPGSNTRLALRPEEFRPTESQFDAIDLLVAEAGRRDTSPGVLALAWVMHHPQVSAPISGPSRAAEHLQIAREALELDLDDSEWQEIAAWFD
jgi:aryl-alcohol dehydrogenase-like predicted oxidoreductase